MLTCISALEGTDELNRFEKNEFGNLGSTSLRFLATEIEFPLPFFLDFYNTSWLFELNSLV